MKKKTGLDIPSHEFAFIVFVDPAYSSGWTSRDEEPSIEEIIHVGTGVIVKETKTTLTIALMVGLFDKDKKEDVLNPFTLHKRKGILWLHRFSWEDYNGLKKSKRISKQIDESIEGFIRASKEPMPEQTEEVGVHTGTTTAKEKVRPSKSAEPLHKPS
jgi:hypothetical protein